MYLHHDIAAINNYSAVVRSSHPWVARDAGPRIARSGGWSGQVSSDHEAAMVDMGAVGGRSRSPIGRPPIGQAP